MVIQNIKRPLLGLVALVFTAAAVLPSLGQQASAYGLVTNRFIRLSSSQLGGTDVTYLASFDVATTASVGGVVIDICQSSPIVGDACTTPTGFDFNEGTVAVGQTTIAGFTKHANTDANTLILTNGTPQALTAAQTVTITLGTAAAADGVSNPTDNVAGGANEPGTYFARILTYDTQANAAAYSSAAADGGTGTVDAGGIALSTANQLTITSKVQERLTFCVFTTGADCSTGTGSAITLGDTNGVLDPGTAYTNNAAKFGLSSNAASGVVVNMKGGTLKRTAGCADGTGQNCSIDPLGNAATASAPGSEQFGVSVSGAGTLSPTAPYNTANYAFDDNNTTGTQSTYGKQVASMTAGVEEIGTLEFVGNIGFTTESGIYTTALTFIATGTY